MESRKASKGYEDTTYAHMDSRGNLTGDSSNFQGLRFDSGRFDIVIDKGCLDCLVCTDAKFEESQKFIELSLCEAARVLKPSGGFYILVSCAFEHQKLDKFFHVTKRFGWKLVSEAALGSNTKFPARITIYKNHSRYFGKNTRARVLEHAERT